MSVKVTAKDFAKAVIKKTDTAVQADKNLKNLLLSRGMPKVFFNFPAFALERALFAFVSSVDGMQPIQVSFKQQKEFIDKIMENPWFSPYTFCISSAPNDMQAKTMASYIFSRAVSLQLNRRLSSELLTEKTQKRLLASSLPFWETLETGYESRVLTYNERPSLLVMSSLTTNSTQYRVEKVRDLMERFADIPKILIVSGADPVTYFNKFLFLHLNGCCFLQNSSMKATVEV